MSKDRVMQAYSNDPAFRMAFIAELKLHQQMDMLKRGTYGEGLNGDFRGCAVGCGIHSLAKLQGRKLDTSNHSILAAELKIPVELIHLQDGLFESLPLDRAMQWPVEFAAAISPGADCSQVHIHFLYWLLTDPDSGAIRFVRGFNVVRDAINQVGALLIKELAGIHNVEEWDAAWSAAESARSAARDAAESARSAAWSAAWSAAESARAAARSAARDAAESARSAAWSAARSAARDAAWSAAWSAARIQQADKLLQLLKEAPHE